MRIARVRVSRVRYPQGGAKVTAHDVVSEHFRTLIRLWTEDGLQGVGEASGAPDIFRLAGIIARDQIGHDPRNIVAMRRRLARAVFHQKNGRNGWIAYGGVELACWDLAARRLEVPLHALLGGARRSRVAVSCGLGAVPLPSGATRNDVYAFMDDFGNVDRVVEDARERIEPYGFGTIKIKSAAYRPEWDLRVMTALRDAFGPAMNLRIDPNAGYSPAQALRLFPRLDPLGLEWFEDPTSGIEGMARLRRQVRTPLATNMCCIQFDQLAPTIRLGAVDVVLGDVYHWGGLAAVLELTGVCRVFGLGFGIHSVLESEWDIGVAAKAHIAAALTDGAHAMAGTFPSPAGGIVKGEPFPVANGEIPVPDGPGLGVELDEDKLIPFLVEELTHDG